VSLPVRLIDYGLRDYGTAKWEGGDPNCNHNPQRPDGGDRSDRTLPLGRGGVYHDICAKCGAVRIDQQIGLEQTPAEYVDDIVQVFREVWRVLRDNGVVWLNLGDSYNGSGGAGGDYTEGGLKEGQPKYPGRHINNLKPKDLIGIPWMVAFALRDDGWYLRQDIIWHKPNPMPESVKDRCTRAHEYVFLLSKSPRYYYDYEAVLEPISDKSLKRAEYGWDCDRPSTKNASLGGDGIHTEKMGERFVNPKGRNRRSVWTITTSPYKGAHYATFPPKLIEPMILAACPQIVCAKCGAPYQRVLERVDKRHWTERNDYRSGDKYKFEYLESKQRNEIGRNDAPASFKSPEMIDKGFQPTCNCNAGTTSGIVLDPFVGSGTTIMVANQLGRRGVGLDLSFKYLHEDAKKRIEAVQPKIFA
jgi:site-specific DNA-methyltransferase (adenine-specific)